MKFGGCCQFSCNIFPSPDTGVNFLLLSSFCVISWDPNFFPLQLLFGQSLASTNELMKTRVKSHMHAHLFTHTVFLCVSVKVRIRVKFRWEGVSMYCTKIKPPNYIFVTRWIHTTLIEFKNLLLYLKRLEFSWIDTHLGIKIYFTFTRPIELLSGWNESGILPIIFVVKMTT